MKLLSLRLQNYLCFKVVYQFVTISRLSAMAGHRGQNKISGYQWIWRAIAMAGHRGQNKISGYLQLISRYLILAAMARHRVPGRTARQSMYVRQCLPGMCFKAVYQCVAMSPRNNPPFTKGMFASDEFLVIFQVSFHGQLQYYIFFG